MIVTIDGPAGTGKTSVSRQLANRLGFRMLDTGAMYRIVALLSRERGIDHEDADALEELAESLEFATFDGAAIVNGEDVGDRIRTAETTRLASFVAQAPGVRRTLVEKQRRAAEGHDVVTEGRDQGTTVFPHAERKIFLTASIAERARRRAGELEAKGESVDLEALQREIADRDERDANRAVAPLEPAADAIVVDTSTMSLEEVVDRLEALVLGHAES